MKRNIIIITFLWLTIGLTLKHVLSDYTKTTYTDIEMAQTFIKDNPDLCRKSKTKILDDGTIRITLKRGKSLYLKDGVLTRGK